MKVLFYTNIPSPYRVDFFNELGKLCDLTVLFELDNSTERNDAWKKYQFTNFKGIVLKGKRLNTDTAFCPEIVKYLKRGKYDQIIVSVLASPTALLASAVMRMRKISYCYEGDGGFVGATTGIKALMKKFIISKAKLCFSTSKHFDDYCIAYGAQPDNVVRYPFTSVKSQDVLSEPTTKEEKELLREKLSIKENKVIISVGQLIHRKGFDLLLEASRELPDDVGVYIIGGIAPAEYLELKEKYGLKNVHFLDFMSKNELIQYYKAADLFVLFTREDIWGLVINEAMACGLPVISTDKCIAAVELIENGVNGFVVESENLQEMKSAVNSVLSSDEKRDTMAVKALERIQKYTIERMAEEHIRILRNEKERDQ